jgi:hypothetical protein
MTTGRNKLAIAALEDSNELLRTITDDGVEQSLAQIHDNLNVIELLQAQGEPQSSDQVWNEAIEAAIEIANGEKLSGSTNSPRDAAHEVAVDGVVRSLLSLKRPSQAQEPQQFAPCYVCGRPMDGLSEDDCHCFHRRELEQSVSGAVDEPIDAYGRTPTQERQRQFDNKLLALIQQHFPSLPTGPGYTDWGKWLRFANAAAALSRAQATKPAPAVSDPNGLDGNRPLPYSRDALGRMVRQAWVSWANAQPNPKPGWLLPYDQLSESDKEADRKIGEFVARWTLIGDSASRAILSQSAAAPVSEQAVPESQPPKDQTVEFWLGKGFSQEAAECEVAYRKNRRAIKTTFAGMASHNQSQGGHKP